MNADEYFSSIQNRLGVLDTEIAALKTSIEEKHKEMSTPKKAIEIYPLIRKLKKEIEFLEEQKQLITAQLADNGEAPPAVAADVAVVA